MDASESRSYVSPTSHVFVVWKHFGLEMDDSAQRKPRNLYSMQAEGCPWRRHNQFEEPSSHEASLDVHTMSSLQVTWRLRESSFETFVWSTEVKEVPPHSRCSTTVNWLTDTYWKQLTGLAFACQFTSLVVCGEEAHYRQELDCVMHQNSAGRYKNVVQCTVFIRPSFSLWRLMGLRQDLSQNQQCAHWIHPKLFSSHLNPKVKAD